MHGSLHPQPLHPQPFRRLPEQRMRKLVVGSPDLRKAQVQRALGMLMVGMTCCNLNAW